MGAFASVTCCGDLTDSSAEKTSGDRNAMSTAANAVVTSAVRVHSAADRCRRGGFAEAARSLVPGVVTALIADARSSLARVEDPASGEREQHQRHEQRDREQEPRERGAVRHLLECEERLVEVEVVEVRGAGRLARAVLQHERDEEVLENIHDAED